MQEKFTRQRLPMLMNSVSVIASLMRGNNLINVWLTQQFDSGVHVYALVCLLGVDTLNICFDWNKPYDLLLMTSSMFVIKL